MICDGESLPVPFADIADSFFGLLVREVDDMSAASGRAGPGTGTAFPACCSPNAGEIWVNAE